MLGGSRRREAKGQRSTDLPYFGYAAAIDGDTAAVGAYLDDIPRRENAFFDAGSVSIFVRSGATWKFQAELTAPYPARGGHFGSSVALAGDTVLVGANGENGPAGYDVGAAYAFVRSGTTWSFQDRLVAPHGASLDLFGTSVALAGDTAVVGAPEDDTSAGTGAGSAFVFVRSGDSWSPQARLTAPDAAPSDSFGSSVAVAGDTAIVGGRYDDTSAGTDAGSASVFVRSGGTWTFQAQLGAADPGPYDYFGSSLALSGDTAVVGAYFDDTPAGVDAGSAHVFVRSGTAWTQQARLTATEAADRDHFGRSVALDGDTAVIGAFVDDTPDGVDAGSAHVFVRSETVWAPQAVIGAPEPAPFDSFGSSVAVDGDTIVVGAYLDDTLDGTDVGSAAAFVRTGSEWSHQAELEPPQAGGDSFGYSVSIAGDTAAVGAYLDDTATGYNAGSASVFVRTGTSWVREAQLTAPDGDEYDYFGYSVALDGDTVLVGAYGEESGSAFWAGAVYVFVRSGASWALQAKLDDPEPDYYDYFGYSVALDEDTAVVGAWGDYSPGGDSGGTAYVYERTGTTWALRAELIAPDGAAVDYFGISGAVDGDSLLVGAAGDDSVRGSAYVFVRSGSAWDYQAKLTGPDSDAFDLFGLAVDLAGDTALVGAPGHNSEVGRDVGSAYVFSRSETTWGLQTILIPPGSAPDDRFGRSVALDGGTAVVGAWTDDTARGFNAGSASVFVRSGPAWTVQAKLAAPDGSTGDRFGGAVDLDGNTAVLGSDLDDFTYGTNAGSAYVFGRTGDVWRIQAKLWPLF